MIGKRKPLRWHSYLGALCVLAYSVPTWAQDQDFQDEDFSDNQFSDQEFSNQEFGDNSYADQAFEDTIQDDSAQAGSLDNSSTQNLQQTGQNTAAQPAQSSKEFLDQPDDDLFLAQDEAEQDWADDEATLVDTEGGNGEFAENMAPSNENAMSMPVDPAINPSTLNQVVAPEALQTGVQNPQMPAPTGQDLAAPGAVPLGATSEPEDIAMGADSGAMPDSQAPAKAYQPIPAPNEFSGTPPLPGSLRQLADGEAPDEYYIEDGDTLFDIGDQLLDEPSYWPKLWALNPHIKNPHFIYPGMAIRFYPGDDEEPPFLQVVIEEELPIEPEFAFQMLSDIFKEKPLEIPITEVIDSSQLEIPFNINELFIDSGEIFRSSSRNVRLPGFIFDAPKEPLAVIVRGTQGEITASPKSIVVAAGNINVDTTYTILRPAQDMLEGYQGHLYYFVANTRTFAKATEPGHFLATLSEPLLGTSPGDILIPYISTLRTFDVQANPQVQKIDAKVVAFQSDGKKIGRAGDFVFFDAGSAKVSNGQYVSIHGERGYWDYELNDGIVKGMKKDGAIARIIDVTSHGSVGYLVHSYAEIRVGDVSKF